MADMERLAKAIANSGLFGIRSPEAALVLMAIAQAEGRHPAAAARDYDIINGRPAKKTEAMHRDFIAGGGRIEWHQLDDSVADATFHHAAGTARIQWDMARAAQAQLGGRDMWKKYPRQMLRNRCISEGVRSVFPAATSGFYDEPGEVADIADPPKTLSPGTAAAPTPSSANGNGQDGEPNWPDLVERFDQAQARITNSDDAKKLLEWKPGVIAITGITDGELKRSYLAMRKEVEQQWLQPITTDATTAGEDINF
jgi:hypothetical protein